MSKSSEIDGSETFGCKSNLEDCLTLVLTFFSVFHFVFIAGDVTSSCMRVSTNQLTERVSRGLDDGAQRAKEPMTSAVIM